MARQRSDEYKAGNMKPSERLQKNLDGPLYDFERPTIPLIEAIVAELDALHARVQELEQYTPRYRPVGGMLRSEHGPATT